MWAHDTYFLTGTDEHGQKIERSAAAAGKTPQQLTDEVTGEFRALWDRMGISYDEFIRTTSPSTSAACRQCSPCCASAAIIYKGSYTGQYCVFDELYVNDSAPGTPCPVCGRITETVTEENYFFKLSAIGDKLLKLYEENPGLHPSGNAPQRSDRLRQGWTCAISPSQPHHHHLGHPRARRSGARDLRMAGRALQLHHRRRLRLAR